MAHRGEPGPAVPRGPLTCGSAARRGFQNTMFTAIAGVTVAVVLRPISMIRTPSSAPMRLLQLYSIAGANPSEKEEPDCCSKGTAAAAPTVPVTRVLSLCWYTTSNASTQLRVRLYSAAASAVKESPGYARPLKPVVVPYTLTSCTLTEEETP